MEAMKKWDRKLVFKYLVAGGFCLTFALLFTPFLSEIVLAAVFALAMEPSLGRLLQPRHFRWRFSVAVILIAMFLVLALPLNLVIYKSYKYVLEISKGGLQGSPFFQKVLLLKGKFQGLVERLTESMSLDVQFDLAGILDEAINRAAASMVQLSTTVVSNIPSALLSLFVFCAALYFFLAEGRKLKSVFMKQRLLTAPETDRLIKIFQDSSYATVVTSLIVAVVQASIVGLGALIFKGGDVVIVWVITFFLSFIPMIGAGPVALTLALLKLVVGDFGHAIGFVIVALIAGTMDNIVRAYLLSSQEQDLNPIVSLLTIIGAILIFGLPGLFLGPVIASIAVKIIPTLFES